MMTKLQMKHQCNIVSHGKARTYLWFLGLWIMDVFLVNPVIRLERQEGLYKLQKVYETQRSKHTSVSRSKQKLVRGLREKE
jgi:surface polysaccharide O-acyltransferase-like enzyme